MVAKTIPTVSAMIGVPRKRTMSAPSPLLPAIATIEENAIKRIGTMIGASVLNADGSFPYESIRSL